MDENSHPFGPRLRGLSLGVSMESAIGREPSAGRSDAFGSPLEKQRRPSRAA